MLLSTRIAEQTYVFYGDPTRQLYVVEYGDPTPREIIFVTHILLSGLKAKAGDTGRSFLLDQLGHFYCHSRMLDTVGEGSRTDHPQISSVADSKCQSLDFDSGLYCRNISGGPLGQQVYRTVAKRDKGSFFQWFRKGWFMDWTPGAYLDFDLRPLKALRSYWFLDRC